MNILIYKMLLMYKILIISLFTLVVLLVYYIKTTIYQPSNIQTKKYRKFFKNIVQLTETNKNIITAFVNTNDNIVLDTLYLKNPDTDKCIIFFHGNAGNISTRYDMIKFLYTYASVIIFDYRAYGRSSGIKTSISLLDLQNDALTIWKYATDVLKVEPSNVCLFGESLGCSLAIYLAYTLSATHKVENYPHSLILNSPFYSMSLLINDWCSKMFKFSFPLLSLIICRLTNNDYKSNEWILLINKYTKILIAHSITDQVIPYNHSKKLFDLISHTHLNSKFVDIVGNHNSLGLTDNYIYSLAEIFENELKQKN